MPRTKRWQNLQKTVQSLPISQGVVQSTLPVQENAQPTPLIQAASQSTSSNQAESQPAPSRKRVGWESNTHWTVDAIDSDENRKTLRLKIKEVLNLSSEDYIVLDFDYLDAPFGEAQALLAGFCGILAADSSLFPMHFEKWPDLPISYFDRVFDQIMKPRFCFQTTESGARKYVYDSILKKWSANRLDIWEAFRDPLKSKAQIMDNVPPGIPRDQWTSYCYYCFKEEKQEMCKKNAENRKKQTIPLVMYPKLTLEEGLKCWLRPDKCLDEHKFILLLIRMKMEHMLMRPQKIYVQVMRQVHLFHPWMQEDLMVVVIIVTTLEVPCNRIR
ncbi:uncharacterized protein LOC132031451 isoform X2 [Lycium ferocissimum]|uniref:uncharacterized protein LOC132031451 isoform X2 n=1 Tax=Lycium ferocissimum TaxID=112874 RepID=UPI002814D102|nr:uncharacterized protein LOC132031451 isoform X2 [Lycium ferocissimum]